jgi:hypothetical protein
MEKRAVSIAEKSAEMAARNRTTATSSQADMNCGQYDFRLNGLQGTPRRDKVYLYDSYRRPVSQHCFWPNRLRTGNLRDCFWRSPY